MKRFCSDASKIEIEVDVKEHLRLMREIYLNVGRQRLYASPPDRNAL
jgi:hypothetical protein